MKSLSWIFITIVLLSISFEIDPDTTIHKLETEKTYNGIPFIEQDYTFPAAEQTAYFSFDLTKIEKQNKIVFSIRHGKVIDEKSYAKEFKIQCLLSTSNDYTNIVNEFDQPEKNICKNYQSYSGKNFYVKIYSKAEEKISFYIRESGSYRNQIIEEEIPHVSAYVAYEFNKANYLSRQLLITSSLVNSIMIFGEKFNTISNLDFTSVVPISNQSVSSHFWYYDEVIFFFGRFNSENQDESINIKLININEETIKFYYYSGVNFNNGYYAFHYQCNDSITEHYLIANYGKLSKDNFICKYHNLDGTKIDYMNYPEKVNSLNDIIEPSQYQQMKKIFKTTKTKNTLHVFKLKCSGIGNKIVANIKYTEIPTTTDPKPYDNAPNSRMKDCFHTFGTQNFTLNLVPLISSELSQFAIEIFTPNNEESLQFDISFEGKVDSMDNQYPRIFTIKDTNFKLLSINRTKDNIETVISVFPCQRTQRDESSDQYNTLKNYVVGSDNNLQIYYFYEILHEYDANYYVDFEIKSLNNTEPVPICYYLSTVATMQNVGQNCFLLNTGEIRNLTFNKIFNDSNSERQFTFVIYNLNQTGTDYSIKNIYFRTDLPKSEPVDSQYHNFYYKDASLKQGEDSYFNVKMDKQGDYNHIDLYFWDNDISTFGGPVYDVKCISAPEIAIKFIENDFTDEKNLCHIINKDDYTNRVSHILFNYTRKTSNDKLILRITPKRDLNITLTIHKNLFIQRFNFSEAIYSFAEASIYNIFEIKRDSLQKYPSKKIMLYANDVDGIEFYAKKENNFTQIKKGGIVIINVDKILNDYKDCDTFLVLFGRNNCDKFCSMSFKFQLKFVNDLFYADIPEFNGTYHFPVGVNQCKVGTQYHAILDYGKQYKKGQIYLTSYILTGKMSSFSYISQFVEEKYDKVNLPLSDVMDITDNDLHVNILRFKCSNNLFVFFDYLSKQDYEGKEIELKPGSVNYYIIPNNTNYTFNYKSSSKMQVKLHRGKEQPTFYFEGRTLGMRPDGTQDLFRSQTDTNLLYIAATKSEALLCIKALIEPKDLPKTEVKNLYKFENKFIYDIPQGSARITMKLTKAKSNLRYLADESDQTVKICYNAGNMIILEKTENNCFNLGDEYTLNYDVAEGENNVYLVLYSEEENEKELFAVQNVTCLTPEEKKEQDEKEAAKEKDEHEQGGLDDMFLILILILGGMAIIIVIVFIIIKFTKKPVTSDDIEKSIPTSQILM